MTYQTGERKNTRRTHTPEEEYRNEPVQHRMYVQYQFSFLVCPA